MTLNASKIVKIKPKLNYFSDALYPLIIGPLINFFCWTNKFFFSFVQFLYRYYYLFSEHVSRTFSKQDNSTKDKDTESQVSFDSFSLVLDPESDCESEDFKDATEVAKTENFDLCSENSTLKTKRDNSKRLK